MIDEESCKLNDRHVGVRVSSKQRMQDVCRFGGCDDGSLARIEGCLQFRGGAGEERHSGARSKIR
jgi:hypothetical protein